MIRFLLPTCLLALLAMALPACGGGSGGTNTTGGPNVNAIAALAAGNRIVFTYPMGGGSLVIDITGTSPNTLTYDLLDGGGSRQDCGTATWTYSTAGPVAMLDTSFTSNRGNGSDTNLWTMSFTTASSGSGVDTGGDTATFVHSNGTPPPPPATLSDMIGSWSGPCMSFNFTTGLFSNGGQAGLTVGAGGAMTNFLSNGGNLGFSANLILADASKNTFRFLRSDMVNHILIMSPDKQHCIFLDEFGALCALQKNDTFPFTATWTTADFFNKNWTGFSMTLVSGAGNQIDPVNPTTLTAASQASTWSMEDGRCIVTNSTNTVALSPAPGVMGAFQGGFTDSDGNAAFVTGWLMTQDKSVCAMLNGWAPGIENVRLSLWQRTP